MKKSKTTAPKKSKTTPKKKSKSASSKIRKFVNTLLGRAAANDRDAFIIALAEGIVGQLSNEFFINANKMVIGCENTRYNDILEASKKQILLQLRNQGGSMRDLADTIRLDGIHVSETPEAPEGVEVKTISTDILPTEVWFFLSYERQFAPFLEISKGDWTVKLDPQKRYTIGRSEYSRNNSVMLTIPDSGMGISRYQAEFACINNIWLCKQISTKIPTYVDDEYARADERYPLKNLMTGGQIRFGETNPGIVITYSAE